LSEDSIDIRFIFENKFSIIFAVFLFGFAGFYIKKERPSYFLKYSFSQHIPTVDSRTIQCLKYPICKNNKVFLSSVTDHMNALKRNHQMKEITLEMQIKDDVGINFFVDLFEKYNDEISKSELIRYKEKLNPKKHLKFNYLSEVNKKNIRKKINRLINGEKIYKTRNASIITNSNQKYFALIIFAWFGGILSILFFAIRSKKSNK